MTESAGGVCAVEACKVGGGADGLGVVLDYKQVVPGGHVGQLLVEAYAAVKMHGHDGAGTASYEARCLMDVEVGGQGIGFGEHGDKAGVGDGKHGRDVGVGRDNHLVAGLQASHFDVGTQNEAESVKPVAHGHGMRGACYVGDPSLKCVDFFAADVAPGAHHTEGCLLEFVKVGSVDCGKVEKRVFLGCGHWVKDGS